MIFVGTIQEKTLGKDLGTKSEAMGVQLGFEMDFQQEISLSKKV